MSTNPAKHDPLTTLNVSLPSSQKTFVEEVSTREGYTTLSEYVRELIRRDQRARAEKRLDEMLLEGINSGKPVRVTPKFWAKKRDALVRRAAERGTSSGGL